MARRSPFKIPRIPEMTVRRLSVYTRCLLQLEEDGVKTISSQELAERFSLNSAQVRKDLAYFGEFGVRGIGYYVSGPQGRAAADPRARPGVAGGARGLRQSRLGALPLQGLRPAGVPHRRRSSTRIPPSGARTVDGCHRVACADLPREAKARNLQIAIVAVPAESAQAVTEKLVAAGHQGRAQLRARAHQGGQGRAPEERGPVDRAGDAVLLPGPGLPADLTRGRRRWYL